MPRIVRPAQLRTSFDQAAEDYDAARPGYPPALIDDIVGLAALPSPARILEIGCGTGQATRPFAARGDRVVALDIGRALLALAARNLAAYPGVALHHASFEEWRGEPASFDLVMAATAFHWIEPELGYAKAAALLAPGGSLAIFANEHGPLDSAFAEELFAIERRLVPAWPDPRTPPGLAEVIATTAARIDAARHFEPVRVRTYPWARRYTTAEYLRLLNTYSNYRSLTPETRATVFAAIAEALDRGHGGAVTKDYLAVLYLARKPASGDGAAGTAPPAEEPRA